MIVMGIETATPSGGAALWVDGAVEAAEEGSRALSHSQRLMPAIEAILRQGGRLLSDLDALAVSIGPGSFTGLRIGLSVAKALAHAAGKPVVPVSTLEALAWRFAEDGILAAPMLDARRSEIYAALFRRSEPGGPLERLSADLAESPESFAERIAEDCLAAGPGAVRYSELLAERLGERLRFVTGETAEPSAGAVAALGAERFARGERANLLTLEPVYVRKSDAALALERRNKP
jgi:tRNA threonylcarbamoyladenosine biosynthesis protein TsaB